MVTSVSTSTQIRMGGRELLIDLAQDWSIVHLHFRVVDVGPPKKPIRRTNAAGDLSLVQRLLLYDFLEERDGQLVLPLDFVELLDLYSDTDELSDDEDEAAN